MTVNENILLGDCVEVTNQLYKGFYATIIGCSYGDELELQCFERKQGLPYGIYWVLKENDFDSREKCDLKKVVPHIDHRDRYIYIYIYIYNIYSQQPDI